MLFYWFLKNYRKVWFVAKRFCLCFLLRTELFMFLISLSVGVVAWSHWQFNVSGFMPEIRVYWSSRFMLGCWVKTRPQLLDALWPSPFTQANHLPSAFKEQMLNMWSTFMLDIAFNAIKSTKHIVIFLDDEWFVICSFIK